MIASASVLLSAGTHAPIFPAEHDRNSEWLPDGWLSAAWGRPDETSDADISDPPPPWASQATAGCPELEPEDLRSVLVTQGVAGSVRAASTSFFHIEGFPDAVSIGFPPPSGRARFATVIEQRTGLPVRFLVRTHTAHRSPHTPMTVSVDSAVRPIRLAAALGIAWLVALAGLWVPRVGLAVIRLARCRCPLCGYQTEGCPGPTCPECGLAAAMHR